MQRFVLAAAIAVLASPTPAQAPKVDPADKAIEEAAALLEKALAAAKDPASQAKLKAAIDGLKKPAAVAAKPQNESISDFIDNTAKYKGEAVTFRMTYSPGKAFGTGLRDRVGTKGNLFTAKDPKNGAELQLLVAIPAGLQVPAASDGDELVVTFNCTKGDSGDGNVVVSVARP